MLNLNSQSDKFRASKKRREIHFEAKIKVNIKKREKKRFRMCFIFHYIKEKSKKLNVKYFLIN